jgi:Protein of unknown function (DUF2939)
MKRVFLTLLILMLTTMAYAASPLVAVFRLGEAIKAGDSAYLAGKIEWPLVRESLRRSLGPVAMGIPDPAAEGSSLTTWQRIKLRLGQGTVNRIVEAYVTPERLPQLFTLGHNYRRLKGQVEPPRTLANLPERVQQTWSRIKRGVFISPALFEVEAEDRFNPERHYVGLLQLQGFEWRLVSLSVKLVSEIGDVVQVDDEFDEDLGDESIAAE